MGKLTSFMKTFDIYSNFFQLRINNQKKFQTAIGGCMSLFTIAILVICILSMGSDFISRTGPKIVIEEGLFTNNTPVLNGTEYTNRTMLLGVENTFLNYNKLLISDKNGVSIAKECSNETIVELGIVVPKIFTLHCINLNNYQLNQILLSFLDCTKIPASLSSTQANFTCNRDENFTMKNVKMQLYVPELGFNPELDILSSQKCLSIL